MRNTFSSLGERVLTFLSGKSNWASSRRKRRIEKLYRTRDYLEAYSKHTDIRVQLDPHRAVGGAWEQIGRHQFDFLVNNGLQPHHRMLDIGCGTLRGGRHFLRYLNSRNYSGMDISPKAIDYGKQLVQQEGLSEKQPRLLVSRNRDLRFEEFSGETFDYLLAQSVFTHLKPEHIEECFRHVGRIMKSDSVFFFTFKEKPEYRQSGLKGFHYPFSYFQTLADQFGFQVKNRSLDYKHPRGQHLAVLSKKASPPK